MSQEYSSNKRTRRTARSQRNKPVLVTSSDNNIENGEVESTAVSTATIAELKPLVVPTSEPLEKPARKLPGFFSNVKKSEQETAPKEAEVAQARLARATRGKAPIEAIGTVPIQVGKGIVVEGKSSASTPATKPAATKPQGLFKTRYIIGMGVYLIAADFLGLYEQKALQYLGLERQLTQFNLFGGVLKVSTSTIVFLASLVIILVLLARFDLIPRSLGGATNAQRRTGQAQTKNNSTTATGERVIPPTVRQGVKGSDDTLYQQYRTSQRRQKKL